MSSNQSQPPEGESEWLDAVARFDVGRFPPHGQSRVRLEGDLVFYEHTGPFNAEFFRGLGSLHLRSRGSGRLPTIYAAIVKFNGSVLMTPEALEVYSEISKSVRTRAVGFVIPADAEGRKVMMPALLELWGQMGCESAVFEEMDQAVAWARARLADAYRQLPHTGELQDSDRSD